MQNALPVGTIIQERYFVRALLGSSPSGAVYLVQDQYVKSGLFNLLVLKEVVNPSKHKLHQIVLEAMTLRLLQHQALPRVYQVISGGNHDRVYLLMDYIEGPGLERLRVQQPEQRFSFPQAITLMAPVMEAVAYLHRQQPPIIHQNIKPTNILMPSTSDKTVLVNFGIGKRYNLNATSRTAAGQVMMGYKAPEQDSQAAVNQSDIYALGATFYTLLTGVVPLNASYRTIQMESTGNDPLEPINRVRPTISYYVAESIHRALSLSRENRFSSVEQFAEALRADPQWKLSPAEKREFDLALKVASREQRAPEPIPASSLSMVPEQEEGRPPTEPRAESEEIKPVSASIVKQDEVRPPPVSVTKSEGIRLALEPIKLQPGVNPAASGIMLEAMPKQLEGELVPASEPVVREEASRSTLESSTVELAENPTASRQEPGVEPRAVQEEVLLAAEPQTVQEDPRSVPASAPRLRPLHPISSPKWGRLIFVLLLLVVSISLGTVLLSSALRPLAPGSVSPTPSLVHKDATSFQHPTPGSTTPTPGPAFHLANSYEGTIYNLAVNVRGNMFLRRIQQRQNTMSGYFSGLNTNALFHGSLDASRHILFKVISSSGSAMLAFDGSMKADGTLAGNYCRLDQHGQCSGEYGLWSLSPVA